MVFRRCFFFCLRMCAGKQVKGSVPVQNACVRQNFSSSSSCFPFSFFVSFSSGMSPCNCHLPMVKGSVQWPTFPAIFSLMNLPPLPHSRLQAPKGEPEIKKCPALRAGPAAVCFCLVTGPPGTGKTVSLVVKGSVENLLCVWKVWQGEMVCQTPLAGGKGLGSAACVLAGPFCCLFFGI